MSNDIRVILIKIADRLHNMRTLGSMLPNKQYKIAGETLYIYAPLANRLGLYKIKTELENLSFKYEHPEEYAEIEEKLNATAAERDKVFNDFTAPIRTQLDKMGLKYRILARVKSIYSIWNKMQTKHVPFEEIYDLLAVRIIFEPRNVEEAERLFRHLCLHFQDIQASSRPPTRLGKPPEGEWLPSIARHPDGKQRTMDRGTDSQRTDERCCRTRLCRPLEI